jgi:hypothetical protein
MPSTVMPGLVPGIHDFIDSLAVKVVDGRDDPGSSPGGHDAADHCTRFPFSPKLFISLFLHNQIF